jgi:hypothetical protein
MGKPSFFLRKCFNLDGVFKFEAVGRETLLKTQKKSGRAS